MMSNPDTTFIAKLNSSFFLLNKNTPTTSQTGYWNTLTFVNLNNSFETKYFIWNTHTGLISKNNVS